MLDGLVMEKTFGPEVLTCSIDDLFKGGQRHGYIILVNFAFLRGSL